MNEDELTKLLRGSNPAPFRADQRLSARQREIMNGIIAANPPGRRRSPQRVTLALAMPVAAVVALLVVLVVVHPFGAAPAAAYGPAPLTFQEIDESAEEAVQMLAGRARTEVVTQRAAVTTSWDLAVGDAGEPQQTVVISPTVTEVIWTEKLSGSRTVVAGEPYFAAGATSAVPNEDALSPGTVIDDRVFAAGQFQPAAADAGALDSSTARELLDSLAPDHRQAGDAIRAIRIILGEWTLSDDQHHALLQALLEYEGLHLLGAAEDRFGRPVLGLQGSSSIPGQAVTLLISSASGRVVGYETSVLQSTEALPLPVGTVTSYAMWEGGQ